MWRNYDSWGNPLEPRNPQAVPLPPAPVERSYAWEQIKFPDFEKWNEQKAYENAKSAMSAVNSKKPARINFVTDEYYVSSSDDED